MPALPRSTPQYRQFTRQNYLASSEREGGLTHLWHMERLACIRLSDEEHFVDTAKEKTLEESRKAAAETRRSRDLSAREKTLYESNQAVLLRLISAADDKDRRARHMCICPAPDEPDGAIADLQAKANDQARFRHRIKQVHEGKVVRQNKRLLKHLIDVKPGTRTAKELDDWYNNTHKRRLKQLSRFKKAESFAGERILEKECGVRSRKGRGHAHGCPFPRDSGERDDALEHDRYARQPLVARQPFPSPSIGEMLSTTRLPRSLLPALQSTSYGGVALNGACSAGDDPEGGSVGAQPPKTLSPKQRRPEWQSIAATDIPLMHYAADKTLADPSRFVTLEEEGPCTQMWRRRVQRQREMTAETRARERAACSSMVRASLCVPRASTVNGATRKSIRASSTGGDLLKGDEELPRPPQDPSSLPSNHAASSSAGQNRLPPPPALPPQPTTYQAQAAEAFTADGGYGAAAAAAPPAAPAVGRPTAALPWHPPASSQKGSPADPKEAVAAAVAASVREQWMNASRNAPFVAL